MDGNLYDIIRHDGAFIDLSQRLRLLVSGKDRERFLQGQVTQDVRLTSVSQAVYSALVSAKGKMNGDLYIAETREGYRLDALDSLRDSLPTRLERYIIADDVTLTEISSETRQFHLLGPACQMASDAAFTGHKSDRFGVEGVDIVIAANDLTQFKTVLSGCRQLTALEGELIRIEQGRPLFGNEMDEDTLPPEVGIENRAISYHKGCYIGQEVISRIKSVGHVNRQLIGLQFTGTPPALPSMLVTEGREVGRMTSAVFSPDLQKVIALGIVKRDYARTGTRLECGAVGVTVTDLPFRSWAQS